MTMLVDPNAIKNFLEMASFQSHGDQYEREYGNHMVDNFPNCERFWKKFVVPMTKRMNGYPQEPATDINLREKQAVKIVDIANTHYSMFINLAFAHFHLDNWMLSSLENIYAHMGTVCDLAETVIEEWYLLLLVCGEEESKFLQKLERDEFIEYADDWYHRFYPDLYEHYLSKGRHQTFRLPIRASLILEYLGKKSEIRKNYARQSQIIRDFRNAIVHDVKIGRIVAGDGVMLVPKSKRINGYRSWNKVAEAVGNEDVIEKDFVEPIEQAREDLKALETSINTIWQKTIEDFENEFYSSERQMLREMYDIKFASDRVTVLDRNIDAVDYPASYTSGSGSFGVHTGGTAEY